MKPRIRVYGNAAVVRSYNKRLSIQKTDNANYLQFTAMLEPDEDPAKPVCRHTTIRNVKTTGLMLSDQAVEDLYLTIKTYLEHKINKR
jgi:hypothetical protein